MTKQFNHPQRSFAVERRGNGHRQKTAIPKWSHQQELERLIGKEIVVLIDGIHILGMLTAADAFTMQIAREDKSVFTYFKHAITGYTPAPKN